MIATSLLPDLPEPLHPRAARLLEQLTGTLPALGAEGGALPAEIIKVWVLSEFVAQSCLRDSTLLPELLASGDLHREYGREALRQRVEAALADCGNEQQLGERLRKLRKREMVRIAWRDLAGYADMVATTTDLSALADACIDVAVARLHGWLGEQWGIPCDSAGTPQQLVVIGMGKLGAHELNFSSDVDLIFAYPEDGETQGGRRCISNQEYFIKLGQALIRSLDVNTAYGFVFRVDMRLRPFGESSALALSFDAMEEYYQVHGREWERYAMIKARVVAGDRQAGAELMTRLKPFMYRKYIDFGVFESLREMKAMIVREVQRKGMADNVKLGAGGIREVEFIGQAFQLIRGGREATLQVRRILSVLEALRGFELLPDFVVDELVEAYLFLRDVEHHLQEYADQQTHLLPTDEEGRARLAWSMGFADWAGFEAILRDHMRLVHEHFEQVFAAPQTEHAEGDSLDLTGVWQGLLDEDTAIAALQQAGFADGRESYRLIQALRKGRAYLGMSAQGRSRMNHLVPLLIGAVGAANHPDATLVRLLQLLETIGRRSAYVALLVENPMALSQLVHLCDASPWIAHHLSRYPQLLDELLDPRSLYRPPSRESIQNEVRQRLLSLDPEDVEAQMEVLRRIKQAAVLRVAAADVMQAVPLMVVSDHLSEIAEVMIEAAFDLAWRHLVARHGRPLCGDSRVCDTGFAVIAYGKLGGLELGYGSDLDLVFLHSAESSGRMTTGAKPVDNAVFYARLGQRMIHILNTRTPAGVLYEVDTRLRPSGASGLLVSNIDAFADYQRQHAWTWEHQALVRARILSGDAGIAEAFRQLREAILVRERELPTLRREVCEMREKMRSQLSKAEPGKFDLKQDRGGIADIEFMVQYAVLAWARQEPALLRYSDNIRLLETLAACGRISEADSRLLCEAFRAYRQRVHQLALQELPGLVDDSEFCDERAAVQRLWQALMISEHAQAD